MSDRNLVEWIVREFHWTGARWEAHDPLIPEYHPRDMEPEVYSRGFVVGFRVPRHDSQLWNEYRRLAHNKVAEVAASLNEDARIAWQREMEKLKEQTNE